MLLAFQGGGYVYAARPVRQSVPPPLSAVASALEADRALSLDSLAESTLPGRSSDSDVLQPVEWLSRHGRRRSTRRRPRSGLRIRRSRRRRSAERRPAGRAAARPRLIAGNVSRTTKRGRESFCRRSVACVKTTPDPFFSASLIPSDLRGCPGHQLFTEDLGIVTNVDRKGFAEQDLLAGDSLESADSADPARRAPSAASSVATDSRENAPARARRRGPASVRRRAPGRRVPSDRCPGAD